MSLFLAYCALPTIRSQWAGSKVAYEKHQEDIALQKQIEEEVRAERRAGTFSANPPTLGAAWMPSMPAQPPQPLPLQLPHPPQPATAPVIFDEAESQPMPQEKRSAAESSILRVPAYSPDSSVVLSAPRFHVEFSRG